MSKKQLTFGPYFEVVIAAVIWGTTGLFVKYLDMTSWSLGFFRTAVPALLLGGYYLVTRTRVFRGDYRIIALIGTLNALRIVLYYLGFSLTSIGNAVIALYTWPIFGAIYGIFLLRESLTAQKIGIFALAFFGVSLIAFQKGFSFAGDDFTGVVAAVLSSAVYGIPYVLMKKISLNYSSFEMVFHQNFFSAILFTMLVFVLGVDFTFYQGLVASSYAVLIGVVGFGFFYHALKKISAVNASILSYLEVVSAIILAMVFFGESLSIYQIVGAVCILSSSYLLVRRS